MNIDKHKVIKEFKAYTDKYDSTDPKVILKIEHTYRVADIAEKIETAEKVPDADKGLSWLLGMLHDFGRFEQLRRFHTFLDSKSIDHAELGADILFNKGMIRRFSLETQYYDLMEKAIRSHNKLDLPSDLTQKERFFCNMLRDADKVDILKVICETPFEELNSCSREEFDLSPVTEEVFREAMAHKTVNRQISKTPMDSYLNKITFVFGLCFKESFRIVKEQGYLYELLNYHSKNADTEAKMDLIRNEVHKTMDEMI